MKLETFFENFELLTDAPNAVAKLREIVLQLAIRGKLVNQNSNDEDVEILIKQIIHYRDYLIQQKTIRRGKSLPPIEEDEEAFVIPESWQWMRLGDLGDWGAGATPDRKNFEYYDGSIYWFKSGELNDGYISESEEKVTDLALQKCSLRQNKPGDVLIAMYGATIGKVAILETHATTNQAVCACTCFEGVHNLFLFLLLKAYKALFFSQGAGGAQPNISREKIIHTVAPLPPLAEQKRIVEKCDRLLILCDEIEKRQQQRQASLLKMNEGVISQLLTAQTPDDFQHYWQRICNNFDLLYSIPETIPKLRQAILQLAFQGKLVSQIPSEEPANLLLERVLQEKQKPDKQKSATIEDFFEKVEDDEFFFDLPNGWSYTRLGSICSLLSGYAFKSNSYVPTSKNQVIRLGNVKNDAILLDQSPVFISDELARESEKFLIRQGDLLITMTGTKNKRDFCFTALVDKNHFLNKKLYLNQRVGCIRLVDSVSTELISIFLKSNTVVDFLLATSTGTANQANIGVTALRNLPMPLPPLAEQKRIVAKVESLLSLCDALETKLKAARHSSSTLMEVAARQVLVA